MTTTATTITVDSLPIASTIDPVQDRLLIYTASATDIQGISRNILLGLASQPLGLTDTQSPTNKTFNNTNSFTVLDTNLTIQDNGDNTKQAMFQASGITSGQTRTYTLPDISDTLTTNTATQTLTNKTLTAPVISGGSAANIALTVDSISGFTTANSLSIGGISISSSVITTASSIGSGANVTNGVQAAALATNAIKLGKTIDTSGRGPLSATSVAALSSMSVSVTIPAGGRDVEITVFIPSYTQNTGASNNYFSIWDGTVGSGTQLCESATTPGAATYITSHIVSAVVTPAAGSKTYNVGYRVTANSITINNTTTVPAYILVKVI